MQPPVYFFNSEYIPYEASTHVHNWLSLYAPIIILSSMVCFRYCNTRLSFALSYLVLLVTLVHRNNVAGSMSGLPLFATHSNFATMECRMSTYLLSSIMELSSMFYIPFFSGYDNFVLNSSPNKPIDSSM